MQRLSALYRTVEARLELHQTLLTLSGRLELVVSQIELRKESLALAQNTGAPTDKKGKQIATRVYVEGEYEDPPFEAGAADEVEMADGESASEGEIEDVVLKPHNNDDASDDDDEEDSEEEDDSDESTDGVIRPNGIRANGIKQFLDIEAEESDDEDGGDSDTDLDGFINDASEEDDDSEEASDGDSDSNGDDPDSD